MSEVGDFWQFFSYSMSKQVERRIDFFFFFATTESKFATHRIGNLLIIQVFSIGFEYFFKHVVMNCNILLLQDIESESDTREIWRSLTVCLRRRREGGALQNCQVAVYEVIMLENQFFLRKQSVEDYFLARRGKAGSIGIHSSPVELLRCNVYN